MASGRRPPASAERGWGREGGAFPLQSLLFPSRWPLPRPATEPELWGRNCLSDRGDVRKVLTARPRKRGLAAHLALLGARLCAVTASMCWRPAPLAQRPPRADARPRPSPVLGPG